MFHVKLLAYESELLAKQESTRGLTELTPECLFLLGETEADIGVRLADKVPTEWKGWLSFRRGKNSLVICRGRSCSTGGLFPKHFAGIDAGNGIDSVHDYQRGFDVVPSSDLDHLLINFGSGSRDRVFLWYGENIAAYKLIFERPLSDCTFENLQEAVVEACILIITRPKDTTLLEFLKAKSEAHE